jgi:hypothetical protein
MGFNMELFKTDYSGHNAVEIKTDSMRLVIIVDFGPRIAFWGRPNGENLLLWAPGKHFREKWELFGGHRVWVTRPMADECEETYLQDNQACEVKQIDNGWKVTTPENSFNRTKRGITVKVIDNNKLEVDNFLINTGDMLYSGGVWALTCTVPTNKTRYGIPLGHEKMWDYCKIVMFRKWNGHNGGYNDNQFTFGEDMMQVVPKGKENKRMIQADKGIIAMHDPARDILFAKKATYNRELNYPQGCNIAIYVGPENFMVEMETMGPEKTIKPGEYVYNKEIWVLESSAVELNSKRLESLF